MGVAAETAPLTTMASAMFFGSILFSAVALSTRAVMAGDFPTLHQAAHNPRSTALDFKSLVSVYTLLVHFSILGLIMMYAYLCEYHPPFPHAGKYYDRDEFFFLTLLLFLVSFFTIKDHYAGKKAKKAELGSPDVSISQGSPEPSTSQHVSAYSLERRQAVSDADSEVLNRDQTEEWKGWMQFMFLLYHYYHAEEVYNAIRVMITCYVWMTGFGNFSFFYLKGDYGLVRVIQMLWRLNFLVAFLCLTQGTTYILYYICLLHTYFFLMVYFTMRIRKDLNYSKFGIRIKLGVVALIIFAVWDLHLGLFKLLHGLFLGETPMLGATSGALWEWYFRSTLDHWSTYLGMLFALNFPITSLFYRKLEAQPLHLEIAAKAIVAVAFLAATYWWVQGPFSQKKFEYNQTNAYFGLIPLYAYIYLRNLTPWLRSHTLDLLHQIGKTTLETYLMQHHIWLTSDAKSLLTLIPGWPKVNFLVVSVIYVVLSRRLYQLTLFLRGMVLPDDRNACIRNSLYLAGALISLVILAAFLRALDFLNLSSVAFSSVLCGGLMYKIICDETIYTVPSASSSPRANGKQINHVMCYIAGTLSILMVGSVWTIMAENGAGKIKPLPASCHDYVQKGSWIVTDVCNEDTMGLLYRDHVIGSVGTCAAQTPTYVWGWEAAPSNSLCRTAPRDTNSLLKTLRHRNVTFVGDSVIRHLYHASRRQLGDKTAGEYDTSVTRWGDFTNTYKSTTLEFRWSPFVYDLTETLRRIKQDKEKPDLIVMGGGAWDRLHHYGSTLEQQMFDQNITKLVEEMKSVIQMDVPVAWVTPTTINTKALSDDRNNKQDNIREDQMAQLRELYVKKHVPETASFVLDGPSFTSQRTSESYDGVHYPLQVYDAGAQILANAMDWILPPKDTSDTFKPPTPGSMANPTLGLMMLTFVFVSLFLFDGFMGASYLAAICVRQVAPLRLYYEAFNTLHVAMKLPSIESSSLCGDGAEDSKVKGSEHNHESESDDEKEIFIKVADKDMELRVV